MFGNLHRRQPAQTRLAQPETNKALAPGGRPEAKRFSNQADATQLWIKAQEATAGRDIVCASESITPALRAWLPSNRSRASTRAQGEDGHP